MTNPKKEFIEKILVAALIAVLAASFMYSRMRVARRNPGMQPAEGAVAFDVVKATEQLKAKTKRNAPLRELEGSFRDPLKKPDSLTSGKKEQPAPKQQERKEQKKAEQLVLEGVIWGDTENLAIISGNVVSVGETVNGARVIDISENGVTLSKEDGTEVLLKR